MKLTDKSVQERTEFWQQVLRLTHWKITAEVKKNASDNLQGEVRSDFQYLRADMKVASIPAHETLDGIIIHELIHVVLSPLAERAYRVASREKKKELEIAEDQVVEHIVRVIEGLIGRNL